MWSRHMIMSLNAALLASAILVADAEASEPAPDPIAGTVFIFNDGRVERFLRADGETHVWATRRGREYERAANPAVPILEWEIGDRSGERSVFGNANAIWPPRAGARTNFRVLTRARSGERERRSVQAWTCRVGDLSTLNVPAGAFEAYTISCDRFSVNTMRLLEQRTWWWAPDLGHYVRRRYQDMRSGEARDISLCAALPEIRANDARIDSIVESC